MPILLNTLLCLISYNLHILQFKAIKLIWITLLNTFWKFVLRSILKVDGLLNNDIIVWKYLQSAICHGNKLLTLNHYLSRYP